MCHKKIVHIQAHMFLTLLQVVLDIAQRAAKAEGHQIPSEFPAKARDAWRNIHFMLGGHPRLLSYALKIMGRKGSQNMGKVETGREWNQGTFVFSITNLFGVLGFIADMQTCNES